MVSYRMFGSEGPKIKPKKGSKVKNSEIPSLRLRRGGSFFKYFSPPQVPDDEYDLDVDMVWPSPRAVLPRANGARL